MVASPFNLSILDGTNGFVIKGIDSGDYSGYSVSDAGDINGDGIDDVVIGAYGADPDGNLFAGESYVVFGSTNGFTSSIELSSLDGTNGFALKGIAGGDYSGYAVVSNAGDFNGDGIDDLIIGAQGADPNGQQLAGQSYVVFGSTNGFASSIELSSLNGTNGFTINGIDGFDYSGVSVSSAGDINGDGVDDLIIGAQGGDPNGKSFAGESFVVFGSRSGFNADLDLSSLNGTNGFVINGIADRDFSGKPVSAAGDVNNDGIDDLIIGARGADPNNSIYAGQAYVVFGSSSGFAANFELSALDGTNGFTIDGINDFDILGISVSGAGDVNGDGIDDVIVGAYYADPNGQDYAGQSYVIFGRDGGFGANFDPSTLDGTNGFAINGISDGDYSGRSVSSAGDFNGDGIDDVIIGATLASSDTNAYTGQVYVVYGSRDGFTSSVELADLNGTNGVIFNGVNSGDLIGFSVSTAGDVNADGIDDVIIGGRTVDSNGNLDAGESYVVFGSKSTVNLDFGQRRNRLEIEALQDGVLIERVPGGQNQPAPDAGPFDIFAVDSADPEIPQRSDFVDRTFLDQGEGIGITDGQDGNSALRKRIEGDEILGIEVDGFETTTASISVDRIASNDGAQIRVTALDGERVVDTEVFDVGIVPPTGIQVLDFVSDNGPFNTVQISAADSDTEFTFRRLALTNAVESNFTLQLLHAADQEAGVPALEDAPNFSAVLNALQNRDVNGNGQPDYDNTLVLSSGDAFIPGPFFSASQSAFGGQGRGDILIQNELGFQAIAFGNHEFDLGTSVLANLIAANPSQNYPGTEFPYLSANLDFNTDSSLAPLVTADGQEASTIPNSIAGNTIITVNGERIGVVGATTPTLRQISSPGNVTISPLNFDSSDPADIAALAGEVQGSVNDLLADNPDINKVILLAHFQQIAIEQQVAQFLRDVDIIVAGGSNTLLADETDRLRAGDTAQGPYPIVTLGADRNPIAIVNTDGNYQYVGRLVVEFNNKGVIIPSSIDPNISGAYATDAQGVADLNGTPDPEIVAITDQLRNVLAAQEGNIFGNTTVFLNGTRNDVRTEETNLGNLTADANLAIAQETDPTTVLSIKNGGGIRQNIGFITFPPGSTDPEDALRLPPAAVPVAGKEEGDISQLDITNALSFNNGLSLLTVTAEQLLAVAEHGVAATAPGATPGQFPQIGGFAFSFDPDLAAGNRVQSLAILDDSGNAIETVVQNSEVVGDPARTFRLVTLNFLAGGGDGYPFPSFPNTNRVDLLTGTRTGDATFADNGSEQDALAEFLDDNFSLVSFSDADVPPALDTRIQNLNFRQDTVLSLGSAVPNSIVPEDPTFPVVPVDTNV
jgi:5'-nucleotidase/UDP-sugar diphosphatase